MKLNRVLLLVGSPRPKRSNSESLGKYLLAGLEKKGAVTETVYIRNVFNTKEKIVEMLDAVKNNDLIILAAPLYVDSLPSPVIKTLETIFKEKQNLKEPKKFLVLINCGFPEAQHNNTAILIYQNFAKQMGYQWLGGLSLGGGEAINKKEIREAGGVVRHVIKSLDLTIATLVNDQEIPQEAFKLMSKPFVPVWLFCFLGTLSWKKQAKKHGVANQLEAQPYK